MESLLVWVTAVRPPEEVESPNSRSLSDLWSASRAPALARGLCGSSFQLLKEAARTLSAKLSVGSLEDRHDIFTSFSTQVEGFA